jgi:hypothetical protein
MAAPSSGGEITFEPDARLVNISCFDLLLIELVPLAERMARAYEASLDRPAPPASSNVTSTSAKRSSRGPPPAQGMSGAVSTSTSSQGSGGTPTITVTGATANPNQNGASTVSVSAPPSSVPTLLAADGLPSTPIFADSVYVRLERLGFRVGEGLSERFSRDRPRFQNYAGNSSSWVAGGAGHTAAGGAGTVGNINDHQLDVIKFLCKDIWTVVWKKQVDNLKTNHRVRVFLRLGNYKFYLEPAKTMLTSLLNVLQGVFVLTDSKFRPLMRMSMTNSSDALHRAQPHLFFPCGVIRGVLSSLGIKAHVQAETTDLPGAVFQIKTVVDVGRRGTGAVGV